MTPPLFFCACLSAQGESFAEQRGLDVLQSEEQLSLFVGGEGSTGEESDEPCVGGKQLRLGHVGDGGGGWNVDHVRFSLSVRAVTITAPHRARGLEGRGMQRRRSESRT